MIDENFFTALSTYLKNDNFTVEPESFFLFENILYYNCDFDLPIYADAECLLYGLIPENPSFSFFNNLGQANINPALLARNSTLLTFEVNAAE